MGEEDKKVFKRLMRQLDEKSRKSEKAYRNKRKEFIAFIDDLVKNKGFQIKPYTRIYKIYHYKF